MQLMSEEVHLQQVVDGERYLTLEEVAARLGVSLATVRRRISDGRLPATRFGAAVRVSERDLEEAMDSHCLVCRHPYRSLIEVEIYQGRSNESVAREFGIGDSGQTGGELVRGHRARGHMRAREDYQDARLGTLREEGEAAAATEEGKRALRDAREAFAP
jgi:excisionase family DNA binding protein